MTWQKDKTQFIYLFPGGSVKFNGVSLGYTRGISIEYIKEWHIRKNQKYAGDVDATLIHKSAVIKVNLLEFSENNLEIAFDEAKQSGTLEIVGRRPNGTTETWIFNNAFRENTGTVEFSREIGGMVMPVTFRALLDSDGNLGTY